MNYKQHLEKIQSKFGKLEGYNDCTDFDKCVIILKKNNCTYKQIQNYLGSPSKELIKEVILKYIPETLNNDCNRHKLTSNKNPNEKRLIGMLRTTEDRFYDLEEFGLTNFWISDNELHFMDEDKKCHIFNQYDERTQLSIIYEVAKILNIKIS